MAVTRNVTFRRGKGISVNLLHEVLIVISFKKLEEIYLRLLLVHL